MARPMTPEQIKATAEAKKRTETREYKEHMAAANALQPTDRPPVEPPAPSLDPNAGQS